LDGGCGGPAFLPEDLDRELGDASLLIIRPDEDLDRELGDASLLIIRPDEDLDRELGDASFSRHLRPSP
jgi:hypothetical protein